ncbi:MAG: segregation/condensation protein A, partial [Chloroflexota bacterium]
EDLRALKEAGGTSFVRAVPPPEMEPAVKLVGLALEQLLASFEKMLNRRLAEPEVLRAPGPRITQADRIMTVEAGLMMSRTMRFETLLDDCESVVDVIVTFLTVLEMLKQRRIRIWQGGAFGEIILSRVFGAIEQATRA